MKLSDERRAGWLLIAGIGLSILALTAGPAFAALTFNSTTISGDSGVNIDTSSTISIGAAQATGITVGRSGITATFPGTVMITGSTTILGNATATSVTISGLVSSSTQCLHVNSNGIVSGTGSDCGSGGSSSSTSFGSIIIPTGLDPTCAANNTTQIQNAINMLSAAGGGTVYLPAPGASCFTSNRDGYHISSPITLASGVSIRGDTPATYDTNTDEPEGPIQPTGGTWLNCEGGTCFNGNALTGITIQNLGFYNNGSPAMSFGSNDVNGLALSYLENLWFYGTGDNSTAGLSCTNCASLNAAVWHVAGEDTIMDYIDQENYEAAGNSLFSYLNGQLNSVATSSGLLIENLQPATGTAQGAGSLIFNKLQVQINSVNSGQSDAVDMIGFSGDPIVGVMFISPDIEGNFKYEFNANNVTSLNIVTPNVDNGTSTVADLYAVSSSQIVASGYNSSFIVDDNDQICDKDEFYGIFGSNTGSCAMYGSYRLASGSNVQTTNISAGGDLSFGGGLTASAFNTVSGASSTASLSTSTVVGICLTGSGNGFTLPANPNSGQIEIIRNLTNSPCLLTAVSGTIESTSTYNLLPQAAVTLYWYKPASAWYIISGGPTETNTSNAIRVQSATTGNNCYIGSATIYCSDSNEYIEGGGTQNFEPNASTNSLQLTSSAVTALVKEVVSSTISVAQTSTFMGNVDVGSSTLDGTVRVGTSAGAYTGCIEMYDSVNSSTLTYVYPANGTLMATTTKPLFCQ